MGRVLFSDIVTSGGALAGGGEHLLHAPALMARGVEVNSVVPGDRFGVHYSREDNENQSPKSKDYTHDGLLSGYETILIRR